MANTYFRFKQFTIHQQGAAMKVTTDACLFGAWAAADLRKEAKAFCAALDIGTGTGLLSLMLAQKAPVRIDAVEIDAGAAQQAVENFALSPWHAQLQVIQGDINELTLSQTYDCIISNPPFYERELASPSAQRSVALHSKQLQLLPLLQIISNQLKEEGHFYLLLPYKRQKETEAFLAQTKLFAYQTVIVHPSTKHPPFRLLIKGGKQQKERETFSLHIKDGNNGYTPEAVHLLKDYYLYL